MNLVQRNIRNSYIAGFTALILCTSLVVYFNLQESYISALIQLGLVIVNMNTLHRIRNLENRIEKEKKETWKQRY
jgi:hypothetical protein